MLEGQILAEATDEFPLPEESELPEVSASLEVLGWSDESPDEDDPPPPPPPPQEITRRLIINTIRKKRSFFIFFTLILREISSSLC